MTLCSKEKVKKLEDAIGRAESYVRLGLKNFLEINGHQRLITTLLEDLQSSYSNGINFF